MVSEFYARRGVWVVTHGGVRHKPKGRKLVMNLAQSKAIAAALGSVHACTRRQAQERLRRPVLSTLRKSRKSMPPSGTRATIPKHSRPHAHPSGRQRRPLSLHYEASADTSVGLEADLPSSRRSSRVALSRLAAC